MITNLKHLPFFIKEVIFNIKRNLIMTIASISTVMILSIILGFFIILVMNINYWSDNVIKTLQIAVYISEQVVGDEEIKTLQNKIGVISDVQKVTYISKEEALLKMRKKLGSKLALSDIGKNPLPNSFEVSLQNFDKIPATAKAIEKINGVSEVRYGEDITNKLLSLNKAVRATGMIIVAALILATVFIVSNTIKITVYARRREISIMQLVGASNWFIRWPFVLEGIFYGLVGSLIAVFVLSFAYDQFIPQFNNAMPFIMMVKPSFVISRLICILLFTGSLVGITGSWFSVNKYLKNFVSR